MLLHHFGLERAAERKRSVGTLRRFLDQMKPELFVCIEYPYVDKLYRDEYYHYYSSKLYDYNRNCIRLSFFAGEIRYEDFRNEHRKDFLQEHYRGFLVLRPTFPYIIGRSILSPDVFLNAPVVTTSVCYPATVNGLKLEIHGFPHAAQDTEMMVCAETTIWSLMEYFSYRYPEYKPVLPSHIHKILSTYSSQRQIPSNGLTALEISYAIKQLGFGVKLYSRDAYQEGFERILKSYVESGIPVTAFLENDLGIGHVVNIVGRVAAHKAMSHFQEGSNTSNYYDLFDEYVVIDDNHAPYRVIPLDKPALHYVGYPQWEGCKISSFIVPLYSKIYMEADQAFQLTRLALRHLPQTGQQRLILRTLLSSSRSFKHAIALNPTLDETVKELILHISMSKFIWLTEIAAEEDHAAGKARGMILMDATDRRENGILASYFENTYIASAHGKPETIHVPLQPFSIFHNLKSH